jgi:hypothetical protein
MISVVFIVAMLAVPLVFGLPLLRVPSLAGFTLPARTAIAWAGGTLALAALLTALAAMSVAWKPWLVLAIAIIPVVVASRMQAPRSRAGATVPTFDRPTLIAAALAVTIAGAGLVQFAAGAATSADLSYFWGVKATRFALDRGIDFQWLQQPHLIHLHPNYPPLWPVSLAWGTLVAGPLPWTTVPILTWLYVIATGLILHSLLRRRLGRRGATVVSLLWFAVLTGSTARSFSGGSAEGPLLLFVTVAVTTLVVEDRDDAPKLRWLAACALAGAVLTKSEGAVAATLIVIGTAIRDAVWRRPDVLRTTSRLAVPALAAAGLWFLIRMVHGLPLTDPIRETVLYVDVSHLEVILKTCARLLGAGALWVGWMAPLLAVTAVRPLHPVRALPGLAVAVGMPLFAVAYFLHANGNPIELIVWTFPRLIQPAVSAWIICLGVICFSELSERATATRPREGDS